jgi:hypothetical protein
MRHLTRILLYALLRQHAWMGQFCATAAATGSSKGLAQNQSLMFEGGRVTKDKGGLDCRETAAAWLAIGNTVWERDHQRGVLVAQST